MPVNVIIFICTIILLTIVSYLTYSIGKKSGREAGYWKGRGEGWGACEDLVVGRATRSEKINLTEEEILEELIQ
jgi:hypothetical protein